MCEKPLLRGEIGGRFEEVVELSTHLLCIDVRNGVTGFGKEVRGLRLTRADVSKVQDERTNMGRADLRDDVDLVKISARRVIDLERLPPEWEGKLARAVVGVILRAVVCVVFKRGVSSVSPISQGVPPISPEKV